MSAPLNTTRDLARARELMGAAVLGTLSDAERLELAALRAELAGRGVDVVALAEEAELAIGEAIAAMSVGEAAMPAQARDRLASLGERMVAPTPLPLPRRSGGGLLGWAVAAAAAVVAGLGWLRPPVPTGLPPAVPVSKQREALLGSTGTLMLSWKAGNDPSGNQVEGDVVWNNGRQEGFIRLRGAAKNDPSKEQYQLWIFDKKRDDKFPIDGGVFNVSQESVVDPATGDVIIPVHAKLQVFDPVLFAVTREKPAGVVVTDRERIMVMAPTPTPTPDPAKPADTK